MDFFAIAKKDQGSVGNQHSKDVRLEKTSAIGSQHYLGLFAQAIAYAKIHPFHRKGNSDRVLGQIPLLKKGNSDRVLEKKFFFLYKNKNSCCNLFLLGLN
ncbi:MAG: hypothetical protein EBT55_03980 [Proteobacteria bacterium]|nr:hypothetical protein [Pseudomonadota bacterium]